MYHMIIMLKFTEPETEVNECVIKGIILTGPGSVWFGTVVILTRPVQCTANAFTVRFATKVNRAHEQFQFGSIWRTCICEITKLHCNYHV